MRPIDLLELAENKLANELNGNGKKDKAPLRPFLQQLFIIGLKKQNEENRMKNKRNRRSNVVGEPEMKKLKEEVEEQVEKENVAGDESMEEPVEEPTEQPMEQD